MEINGVFHKAGMDFHILSVGVLFWSGQEELLNFINHPRFLENILIA